MDVLHVTAACGGGVRRHLSLLVPALNRRGVSCGLLGFDNHAEADFAASMEAFRSWGIQAAHMNTDGGRLKALALGWLAVKAAIEAAHPRIVHLHAGWAGLLRTALRRRFPDVRIVYSPHAFTTGPAVPPLKRRLIRFMERHMGSVTDAFVFVGRQEWEDAVALGLPEERFHLAENGLPSSFLSQVGSASEARRALNIREVGQCFGVPCRLAPQKGLDCVLKALSMMPSESHPHHVFFCGDGPEHKRLQRLAAKLHVEERVTFMGHVPDLGRHLNAFDAVLLPSRYEGLSYAWLETLWLGVPLIASRIPPNCPREELRSTVQFFEPDDAQGLASCLSRQLGEPCRMEALARQASRLVRREFVLEDQVAKLARVYAELMASR